MGPNKQELFQAFLISFIGWNLLNLIVLSLPIPDKHLPRAEMLDLRNRMVSFVHGSIILFLSGYNTYFVYSQCGEPNTHFEEILLNFSLGYFLYDLLAMWVLGILDRSMLIHHTICISGLIFAVFTNYGGESIVSALFVTEISNPAMHVRVILKHLGLRYTKAYEVTEYSYMVLYLIGRLIGGTAIVIRTWSCAASPLVVKITGTGLLLQSIHFSITMVSILKSRAAEYAERKRKNVKMRWFTALTKEEISKIDAYTKKQNPKQYVP